MGILMTLAMVPLALFGAYILFMIFGAIFGTGATLFFADDSGAKQKGCGCLIIIAGIAIAVALFS